MGRTWHGLWQFIFLGSPALAAPVHHTVQTRPLIAVASARSTFDRVPVAAERIAAGFGIVTSTFRTVAHNKEVGGVPDSYHLLGRAIDVARRPGITHAKIAAALKAAGYMLIESLDEGNHSHFAFAPSFARQATLKSRPAPQPSVPRLAADEHGSLLLDAIPNLKLGQAPGLKLRLGALGKP